MDKKWGEMSPGERQEARFQTWLNPAKITFETPEARAAYRARVLRLKDAIQLKNAPDRVPVLPLYTFLPTNLAGLSCREAMYDYGKTTSAWKDFLFQYQPDAYFSPALVTSGPLLDALGYKLYKWPGQGVSEKAPYQCVEGEYMQAGDYEALIDDPSDFFLRSYLPRITEAFAPLTKLRPLTDIVEITTLCQNLIQYGRPEVEQALEAILAAGREARQWAMALAGFEMEVRKKGYVNAFGGMSGAPFDALGDTLRGTHGIMLDMYRKPELITKAVERLTPLMIKKGVASANGTGNPLIFMPLHKGADGFMSDRQFQTFYWPTLKAVIQGLAEEGCVPMLFAEGGYQTRLEYLAELTPGTTTWIFDQTNMAQAKERIGGTVCLAGNVPASLMISGTAGQVEEHCRELIETAGRGGGYILASGTTLDEARPENLRAMIESAGKYGAYRPETS